MEEGAFKEVKENAEKLKTKWCPFVQGPCVGHICWFYNPRTGPWAEMKKVVNAEGRVIGEEKTGEVVIGTVAKCDFNVFEEMVTEVAPAPDYKVDGNGNVIDPNGKPIKDDFDEGTEATKMLANRLKEIL